MEFGESYFDSLLLGVREPLGEGGQSKVSKVKSEDGVYFAVKEGPSEALCKEADFLDLFSNTQLAPRLFYRKLNSNNSLLVLEFCGSSLDSLWVQKLPIGLCCLLGKVLLSLICEMHRLGYVHGDIKPSNFLVQESSLPVIKLSDFGISGAINSERIPGHVGTPRYCSLNAHKGGTLCIRDDLESWFYMLLEMSSELPWRFQKEKRVIELSKRRSQYTGFWKSLWELVVSSSSEEILDLFSEQLSKTDVKSEELSLRLSSPAQPEETFDPWAYDLGDSLKSNVRTD